MKARGYEVHSGDMLRFAHYFQVARIVRGRCPSFSRLRAHLGVTTPTEIVDFLNSCQPVRGWLTRQFSESRRFFTQRNARCADACRLWIRDWQQNGLTTPSEHAVLLASLIDSLDRVANTAGTYYAHLKQWHRKALRPFLFRLVPPTYGPTGCTSRQCDARELVRGQEFDVVYLDPPYNQRSYAHYYHLPESIALDETPRARGKSGIPSSEKPRSAFYRRESAVAALEEILSLVTFRIAVVHYADNGLVDPGTLGGLLKEHGRVTHKTVLSRGYTSLPNLRTVTHRIYLVSNA